MKAMIRWAVSNTPAMNTLMVAILVVGGVSLFSMRREVFPEFELEIILVTVPYPGASPDEVEQGICQKVEEAVRSISGIKKQTSVANEGAGSVVLEIEPGEDTQKILSEIRSEVDRIPSFPELAEDPEVKQITFRRAGLQVGVIGPESSDPDSEWQLRSMAELIRDELLQLPSVSQANLVNARDYQIDVQIPEATLRKHGLSLQDVAQTIRRQNLELPGGRLDTASQILLLRGKDKQLIGEEIAGIPLVTQSNGVVLTVDDLGAVQDGFVDITAISRINGRPGLAISIDRTAKEDLLSIVEEVRGFAGRRPMPPGYELLVYRDESIDVRDRMNLLTRNGLQGLVLVFLVLTIFLELRLAFWVAMGIPISILGAGALMLWGGQTLNMLSMFAFLMALGIIVDDAIVIGENIYAHRQLGKSPIDAAIDGTVEVLPSVAASVTTTIIAFMPMLFVAGIMGKFIAVMPVAIIAMLLISLFESSLILPCHLAHEGHLAADIRRTCRTLPGMLRWTVGYLVIGLLVVIEQLLYPFKAVIALSRAVNRASSRMLDVFVDRLYLPVLRLCLTFPTVVMAGAIALLIVSVGFVRSGLTPFVVFPKLDNKAIEAKVIFPDGTPPDITNAATRRIEEVILAMDQEYAANGEKILVVAQRSVGEVSLQGAGGNDSRISGSHVGSVAVELVPTSERTTSSQQIIAEWRERSGEFPGAEEVKFTSQSFGPGGKPIEFKLLGDANHVDQLEAAVEACKAELATYPGVFDIGDDSRPGKWEFQLKIRDDARAMGVTLGDLADTVRNSYYGAEVMRLQRGRHEVKLMVRYPRAERSSMTGFRDIRVRTGDGSERPLSELAELNVTRGYGEINRVDQLRSITISADLDETNPNANARNTVAELQAGFVPELLAKFPTVGVRWEGQQEQTQESMQSLGAGFVIALLAMFVLLTLEFQSYLQPLLVMAIIPFGFIGAVGGHALIGIPLTLFSIFGLVALTGVVVNDSIVLIDFINHRIRDGLALQDAIIDAGLRRFRPVMLTSVTTIAGLMPILTERSFQAQILIPMVTSLVFGLLLATILVLVLIPTMYLIYGTVALTRREPYSDIDSADPFHDRESAGTAVTPDLVSGGST